MASITRVFERNQKGLHAPALTRSQRSKFLLQRLNTHRANPTMKGRAPQVLRETR